VQPPQPLDLRHQGRDRVIGVYLVHTPDGLALHDCGPASALPALQAGLAARGIRLQEIRHLLLSHIHLDHAGAAGAIVREHPALQVHVSELGAPHLADPSRLEASARRLYGDTFDTLWGELVPVPQENIRVVGDDVLGLECFPAPGHARHHVCYLARDGTLYAGDAAGVRIQPTSFVMPPTPPPDIDVEAWQRTIAELARRGPERLALTHFGVATDVDRHLGELSRRLDEWSALARDAPDEDAFVAAVEEGLDVDDGTRAAIDGAIPLWQSYQGLARYWRQRRGG
jgi:glyoxylase-like metal-dependent hydrolase (beta-lactamase superfamily II)